MYTRLSPPLRKETHINTSIQFLNKTQLPPIKLSNMANMIRGPPELPNTEQEYTIEILMRDGYKSKTRIHQPASPPTHSPLVVLIYGGGFVVGDFTQFSPVARSLAALYGATLINISYRLSPKYKFPTAPQDVWDSLKWIAANYQSLGADPTAGFVVGGASAGGNLAAAAAQKMLDEKFSPPLTGIWLSIPYVLEAELVPAKYKDLFFSREQNSNSLIINKEAIEYVTGAYEPDKTSPDFSPFNNKRAHTGLPPVYIEVCGQDPFRDDGLVYEKVLRDHGVRTRLRVYPGVPHGHGMLANFGARLTSVDKAKVEGFKGLSWLLGKDEPAEETVLKTMDANKNPT
jgi:acetyl esterase/lipase